MTRLFNIVAAVLLLGSAAYAEDAKKSSYVLCKNKEIVRTIRIHNKNGSCRTTYTKEGLDTEVGKSKTNDVCENVLNNIRKNLESANWKCKDISESRLSMSPE